MIKTNFTDVEKIMISKFIKSNPRMFNTYFWSHNNDVLCINVNVCRFFLCNIFVVLSNDVVFFRKHKQK